jgi:F0F1-type ATP synthase assembly protein I
MFALLIPLVLQLAPQLAGMIFGSKGSDTISKVADVVQSVVGVAADLKAPGGVAAAVAHFETDPQASADLAAKLSDLHLQMQKEQDAADEAMRQDALDELKAELADTTSARNLATSLAQSHSGLAYGSAVVSVVIILAFGWMTYLVLTNHMTASGGQFGSVLVGTLAAMATQVANYWLGSSLGSSTKNALLASAQNNLASSVPSSLMKPATKT